MNIGIFSQALPYLPSRGGFRLYGGNLIRALSTRHRIDLVSLLVDDDAQHLDWARRYCASVRTVAANGSTLPGKLANAISAHLWGRPLHHRAQVDTLLRAAMREHRWDVLHVEGGFAGGLLAEDLPLPKVLSLHDSWTLRCDEMLKCAQSLREKAYYTLLKYHEPRFERLVYPRFERCVVVADPDVAAVRATVPAATVALIPYGTDTEYFHPVLVEKEPTTMVFHSHLGYAPNIEAGLEFANAVFPLVQRTEPAAVFHLVGADPDRKITALGGRPGIRISPNLPDLRAAVCSASLYVCAIRHGTGLKSKVLEAMAMGLPIVCYPGSTVGIECIPGRHLLVAQDPQEFAAHVLGLLRSPSRAAELAREGRRLVEEKYSWESRAHAYEALYESVIEERRARAVIHAAS